MAYAHLCAAFSTDGCNSHREWRLLVLPARDRLDPQNDEFVQRARRCRPGIYQVELAARWRISPRTLERWRWAGGGPRFIKIGGRVVYRIAPERNEANVITALSCDEAFAGTLVFDEFRQEIVVNRPLPWDEGDADTPRPWTDADDVRCAEWLQRREINVAPVVVSRSVGAVARDIRVHPVREYLNRLHWDGTPRLEAWTVTHLGAEDTPLNRAFGSLWMISAVARIMQPGSKADHMLILEGPQGAKKSTALAVLAGDGWFTDELAEIGSKDAALQMRGVWIIEIAELDAIGRAEVSRIKAFLSRTVDRYRPPYDRYVVDVPRQCVFAGSVNPDTYLRDETGNRRFWPVRCGRIDLDALRRDRDQLWAEAVVRYREGAIWWIDDRDLITAASAEQQARVQDDAWHGCIERWLVFEKRQVNRGYAGFDDWQTEEIERARPLTDVSVGEILAARSGHRARALDTGRSDAGGSVSEGEGVEAVQRPHWSAGG